MTSAEVAVQKTLIPWKKRSWAQSGSSFAMGTDDNVSKKVCNEAMERRVKSNMNHSNLSHVSTNTLAKRVGSSPAFSSNSKLKLEHSDDKAEEAAISPVEFLRSVLSSKENIASSDDKPSSHSAFFTEPNQEEMAAYDTTVVTAIRARDVERLRTLRKEGRNFNACNRFGESLLHMACRRGHADIVSFLVNEAGVRVNVRDDYGRTPFHDACWTTKPNIDVMDVLLNVVSLDALLAKDVRGHMPFDYARREHWASWVQFLRQRK